jgi:hypothetical protein
MQSYGRIGGVEKVFFNHKAHKEGTKNTKVKIYISVLYVIGEIPNTRDCELCG